MDQLSGISSYRDNDVLSGRGSAINNHQGNRFFQSLVKALRAEYVATAKVEKPIFARKIVEFIRGLNPPGRFLKQDPQTQLWYDIGNRKAMDKTRQALREGAPDLAKHIKEGSLKIDVPTLEQMISNHARSVFDDMHIQPQAVDQDCSHVTTNLTPNSISTQLNHCSMHVPNIVQRQQDIYHPTTEYQQYHSSNPNGIEYSPSSSKRIFDPAEGKFVEFRFSHTSAPNFQHEPSPDNSDIMRQSMAPHATYSNLLNESISVPYSEDWNLTVSDVNPQYHLGQSNLAQQPIMEQKDDLPVHDLIRIHDEDGQTIPPRYNYELNRDSNDWRSRNSLFLKNVQEKVHSQRSQDFEPGTEIGRLHTFVTELNGLDENSQKEPFLPSSAGEDEELSSLRNSLSSSLSISDGPGPMKASMRSSLSMSEVFQSSSVQNPNAMSLSSLHSQKMSLVLRQSFLSEWVDKLETENGSPVENKSLYVPDVFGSKVDKRREVVTESSQQLLEAVFGSDLFENTNTEDEKELLRNILNPNDEMMLSSGGMDMSGIWKTG